MNRRTFIKTVGVGSIGCAVAPTLVKAMTGPTRKQILEWIVALDVVMDDKNVPKKDRWISFPDGYWKRLYTSDLEYHGLSGDGTSIWKDGYIGIINGFYIYEHKYSEFRGVKYGQGERK